ncbi:hypothetical protein [Clostridium sp. B9]|uniref:hypothetical protein n=1 Tax=Clostridium sp. B9 TaxID=3423224 RepID=UPI003D2F2FC0
MKNRMLTASILLLEIFIVIILILKFLGCKLALILMPYAIASLILAIFLLGIKMYKIDRFIGIIIFFFIIAAGIIYIL